MAVASDSVQTNGRLEELGIPQSPGADYGLTNDFDPARYDFYNPVSHGARRVVSEYTAKEHSPANAKHHEEECGLAHNHDKATPESLSPIEELDDDAQSFYGPRESTGSVPPKLFQGGPQLEARNVDSGYASHEERTRGFLPLELRTDLLFSRQHLQSIFADRVLALRFITFLRTYRPQSVSILTYYLGAVNALKALRYGESIISSLEPVPGQPFTSETNSATMAWVLEDKIVQTLDVLVQQDMPAFITYTYAKTIDFALAEKMTGRQDPTSRAVADGLFEAFVLSDPAIPDNPIVFTSEGFHSLTGYCRKDFLGRNCRILGGTKTSLNGKKRFKSSLDAEREHCEILLNYRRDGSPFINLVMCVPLRDQSSKVRYYLGAQLDITRLVNNCIDFSSFRQVLQKEEKHSIGMVSSDETGDVSVDESLNELIKTFSAQELEKLAAPGKSEPNDSVLPSLNGEGSFKDSPSKLPDFQSGGIAPALGFYQNYLLARPHPSLRILFASPELCASGILQQPLMESIGGSSRIRQDLARALEMGRKVTAKVQWLSRSSRTTSCWLHCTPLLGATDSVGVWVIILVSVYSDNGLSQASTRAPKLRVNTPNGDKNAADPTPWEMSRKDRIADEKFTPMQGKGDYDVKDKRGILEIKRNRNGGVSTGSLLAAGVDPALQVGSLSSERRLNDGNHGAIDDPFSIRGRNGRDGNATTDAFRHDELLSDKVSRPLSSESSNTPVRTQLQPVLKIVGRSSDERKVGKPAPINMPGAVQSLNIEDDTEALHPVRKRTYKSLSPYGIIFDD